MRGIMLAEHDPDLFAGLDESALDEAQAAIVPAWSVEEGPWAAEIDSAHAPFGILIVSGCMAREVSLNGAASMEVLGPGDVLRPWALRGYVEQVGVSWRAVTPSVIAALDVRFGAIALRHPAIIAALLDRSVSRAQWLALQLAVTNIVGLDKRLETMLWHLTERWGKVGSDGVILPFRFNHDFLAKLVGVRRPSATSAITRLKKDGVLERRPDGTWLLRGRPPIELGELQELVLSDTEDSGNGARAAAVSRRS